MGLENYVNYIKPFDPMEADQQIENNRALRNTNRLADLGFAEKQREIADTQKLNAIYSNSLDQDGRVDRNKLESGVVQGGMGNKAIDLRKRFAEQDKLEAEVGKEKSQTKENLSNSAAKDYATQEQRAKFSIDKITGLLSKQTISDDDIAQVSQEFMNYPGSDPKQVLKMVASIPPESNQAARREAIEAMRMGNMNALDQMKYTKPDANAKLSADVSEKNNIATNKRMQLNNEATNATSIENNKRLVAAKDEANNIARTKKLENESTGTVDMGLPKPVNVPWAAVTDPKSRASMQARVFAADSNLLNKASEDVTAAKQAAQDAVRFIELNKNVSTGGVIDKFGAGRWASSFGAENAEMQAITAKLAPNMRPAGSGATSNYDAQQFERATLSVDKKEEANANIAAAIKARARHMEDYQSFRQSYLEQNQTLQGADRAWSQYAEKNPILDPEKPGTYELNPKRKSWQEVFTRPDTTKATGNSFEDKNKPLSQEVKQVVVNGAKYEAKRAPDGKYYVKQPNGKYARVD